MIRSTRLAFSFGGALICAILFAVAGCQLHEEPKSDEGATDQAKTPAKLIVGTWKRVKQTPPSSPPNPQTVEYKTDGTCTLWLEDFKRGLEVTSGTYKVEGSRLVQTFNPEFPEINLDIDEISRDKLVISIMERGVHHVVEYERVYEARAPR